MINILQTPLLRQLGRGLLLYRLLRRNGQSERQRKRERDNGSSDRDRDRDRGGLRHRRPLGRLYLCRFLLAAVSVPIVFFLLLGLLLLPFFMLLLLLLLSGPIVAGDAVRVLAVVPLSVRLSVYIAVLGRRPERGILKCR